MTDKKQDNEDRIDSAQFNMDALTFARATSEMMQDKYGQDVAVTAIVVTNHGSGTMVGFGSTIPDRESLLRVLGWCGEELVRQEQQERQQSPQIIVPSKRTE